MTVLYIYDYWTGGGAPASGFEMISFLKELGVNPIVCISSYDENTKKFEDVGIKTIETNHYPVLWPQLLTGKKGILRFVKKMILYHYFEWKSLKLIERQVNIKNIDLIHTNSQRCDIGCLLSIKYKIPHIMHIREYADLDYKCRPVRMNYISLFNRGTTNFICISNAIYKHWLKKGLSPEKLKVIYNGVKYEDIKKSSDQSKADVNLKIVMLGLVQETKGQYLAIEALELLPRHVQKHVFVDIIGYCYPNYRAIILNKIQMAGLSNQIKILGARNDTHHILGDYHVGLMCSSAEGFGRVTVEYMHAQLGVIASDSGANPEIVDDSINGLLFKSGNAQSLANSIIKLYDDRGLLIKLSHAAYYKARNEYTQEINARNVCKLYKNVLADE